MERKSSLEAGSFDEEPKVRTWRARVREAGCTVESLEPLHLLHKRNGELLFALLHARMRDPSGHSLLPYVLIRGDAALVVPRVRDRQTGEERFVMVRQRRSGSGRAALEFPAGMLDRLVDDPVGVAAGELVEETGIRAVPDELFPLTDRPLFTSPGLQDEAIHYFGYEAELSHREFTALRGRRTGNGDEGERIEVSLATRAEGEAGSVSTQVRLGFYLFDAAARSR